MFHLMSFNHLAGCTIKLPAIRFNCAIDERLVQAPNRLGHHHLAVLWCFGKENPGHLADNHLLYDDSHTTLARVEAQFMPVEKRTV